VKPDGGKTSLHMRPVNQLLFPFFFDNCHARLGTAWVLPHPVSTMTVWMLSLHKGSPFCISAHHSLSSNHIHDRKVLIILFRKFQVMIACVRNLLLETIKATH